MASQRGLRKTTSSNLLPILSKKSCSPSLKLNLVYNGVTERLALNPQKRRNPGRWLCISRSLKPRNWYCIPHGRRRRSSMATRGFTSTMTTLQKRWQKERRMCRLGDSCGTREYGFRHHHQPSYEFSLTAEQSRTGAQRRRRRI